MYTIVNGLYGKVSVPKKPNPVQNDGYIKVLLKKYVYLPNNYRVNARIVNMRLFDSRKDACKRY